MRIDKELHDRISAVAKSESYYLVDLDLFAQNYLAMSEAARKIYPNSKIAYSYKTNYLPVLCKEISRLGGLAEVVSEFEYEIATQYYDIDPVDIVVNGPVHNDRFIRSCIERGSLFQVDSMDIFRRIVKMAADSIEIHFAISIRMNIELEETGFSRFGIEPSVVNLAEIAEAAAALSNLCIAGMHTHISLSDRSLASFRDRARTLLDICHKHLDMSLIQHINFGGGYFGSMPKELQTTFPGEVPTLSQYGELLGSIMVEYFGKEGPRMIMEPGTALVADAMQFVCRVECMKNIRGSIFAVVDGSIQNIQPVSSARQMPCHMVLESDAVADAEPEKVPIQIVGYTCLERDILFRGLFMPLSVGDCIAFQNVGAYTLVMKPPFIKGQFPIVSRKDQELKLEYNSEDVGYFMSNFKKT